MEQFAPAMMSGVTRGRTGMVDHVQERGSEVPDDEGGARDEPRTPPEETATAGVLLAEPGRAQRRQRVRTALDLIRSNPTGRIALKIFIAIAGALVVSVGVALIPLPGPGWLVVIGGLAIWAVEFHWARRLLTFTRRHVQGWASWVGARSRPVRLLLGAVGLVFVCVVIWLSLKYSLGIDLVARAASYLATH
jgi:uncharacterized protein (TIGR02611 family)